ncbi:MAG: metallophosphoesterase family protein [Bacteroidota bacterium]
MKTHHSAQLVAFLGFFIISLSAWSQSPFDRAYQAPEFAETWDDAGLHPDHIVLNVTEDCATSMSVTWRTNTKITEAFAEIAPATGAPKFWRYAKTYDANTETLDASKVEAAEVINNYHSVTFTDLEPETMYAYRVGDGKRWSEWLQFTTASNEDKPFSFLYVGDAQNYILELWSRLVREGYRQAPDASIFIHAGDLVNHAHREREWHEWFTAGGFIHGMIPSLPIPGNHEHRRLKEGDAERSLSVQWRPSFTLPQNGPEGTPSGFQETMYYVDYQGVRFIGLNTNTMREEQAIWLEKVLADNPNKWTVATFHHPLFSASAGRENESLRNLWKPIFDKYDVDIALQGHDHAYARGRAEPYLTASESNVMDGLNMRDYTGTVYVVSVSGGKMYGLRPNAWEGWPAERERAAENTQLVQVITVDGNTLSYEAYTAVGELYDAFDIVKSDDGKPNKFVERKGQAIPARRYDNTISYYDVLPENIEKNLTKKYEGFSIDRVNRVKNEELDGYYVQLEKERKEISLTISRGGEILTEVVEED